ncbi:hypothetical protein SAMN05444506_12284 [Pseudomonas syringae]|uniref:Uncharacterized protein n=2 Tax=Pseudomonas syringae group genomosp. 3 TaxID=251701 RepID=A0A3M3MPC3_9PSED|nr:MULTISPECIES: hypothetical protein [Pseudomonas syringae group]RMN43581.1 hypothetical protein ALQ59_02380 [Pseudomonas syringae pv. apii]RMN49109.1 hypothetical protein ALQ58_200141 [Pseudomonas syringae pv. apii]RMN98551.1 hypothetical protein ALQ49_00328 [Pseudomonas syringae pv. apii]SDZ49897.1 hypothetical protein SAMN05444506_12284 [Pseudomonas syringae]
MRSAMLRETQVRNAHLQHIEFASSAVLPYLTFSWGLFVKGLGNWIQMQYHYAITKLLSATDINVSELDMLRIRNSHMEDHRLLASVALFRSLYDNQRDSYDVLADFIRAAINITSLWGFTVDECSKALKDTFGFKIPTAVLKSCLKRRLKDEVVLSHGKYGITSNFEKTEKLDDEIRLAQEEQDRIILELIDFVSDSKEKPLTFENENKLRDDFRQFFLGGTKPGIYHVDIGKFILSKSRDLSFTRKLNHLEEGVILYQGIEYSPDIGAINSWRSDYSIYLDTEILFWANGYDGVLFESLFKEFIELVKEINLKASNGAKIHIKYFPETKQEVDSIFSAAEHLFKERRFADPSRTAMQHLLLGCKSRSDIIAKKGMFYSLLDRHNIVQEADLDYYSHPQFNCESRETLEVLTNEFSEVASDKIANALKIFTKINYLRGGVSNKGLEQSKAILVSGKNLYRNLAWHSQVMTIESGIPFSTDLDYLTERFWFKLGKGFGGNTKSLVSFDVVARAQIILSTQVSTKVSGEFKELIKRVEAGQMQTNDANFIIADLKSKTTKPEDLSADSIEQLSEFLDVDSIEAGIRTRQLLEAKAAEVPGHLTNLEKTKAELRVVKKNVFERDLSVWLNGLGVLKNKARKRYRAMAGILAAIPIILLCGIAIILSDKDSLLSQVGFVLTAAAFIWPFVSTKLAHKSIMRKVSKWYKRDLSEYEPRPKLQI